jgi:hypothetical protein
MPFTPLSKRREMSSAIQELQEALRLEQEACAKLCEQKVVRPPEYSGQYEGYAALEGAMTGRECAAAIRARAKAIRQLERKES